VPNLLYFLHADDQVPHTASALLENFNINPSRLTNTVVALTTTAQVIGFVLENIVPLVTRIVSSKVGGHHGSTPEQLAATDNPREAHFLHRIRQEAALPQYELFGDYAEMVQQAGLKLTQNANLILAQFGYVVLWSTVWPLVPLMAL
jgi:anoctamin-10